MQLKLNKILLDMIINEIIYSFMTELCEIL